MSIEGAAPKAQAGYRKTRVILLLGIALIGFTRLEDRAIIQTPGAAGFDVSRLHTAFNGVQLKLVREAILDACDADDLGKHQPHRTDDRRDQSRRACR